MKPSPLTARCRRRTNSSACLMGLRWCNNASAVSGNWARQCVTAFRAEPSGQNSPWVRTADPSMRETRWQAAGRVLQFLLSALSLRSKEWKTKNYTSCATRPADAEVYHMKGKESCLPAGCRRRRGFSQFQMLSWEYCTFISQWHIPSLYILPLTRQEGVQVARRNIL